MKLPITFLLFLTVLAIPFAKGEEKEALPIIFDTDMGNDIDDAMALATIHQLAHRGAINLLAVTSTKDHPKSASYIDALNTYYGFPDIPIGAVRDGATKTVGRYNNMADTKNDDGTHRYPHDLLSGEDAPDAVELIRKTLASQPDQSVVLLQVGFFTNFARLLTSRADEHSELDGKELIQAKVKELVMMAGAFQTIRNNTKHVEYNVKNDIPSAKLIADEWPTRVVWSGFEIGINSVYPWKSIMEDYEYVDHHLIKESYLSWVTTKPHDRPTWDLSCVLYATYPDRNYFGLSPAGRVTVDDEGRTDFQVQPKGGKDVYLTMTPIQAARAVEAYVQLCSEPPRTK